MADSPETSTSEAPSNEGGAEPASATKPKRPGIKELIQRYGFLALGIYLSTFLVALSLGLITFGFFLDPSSWSGSQGDPPWLIAEIVDLLGLDSGGYWVVTTIAAWLVFVKGSQIPRIMLTAALTPVVAKKLGREPKELELEPEPALVAAEPAAGPATP
jgi:hypothetical protein